MGATWLPSFECLQKRTSRRTKQTAKSEERLTKHLQIVAQPANFAHFWASMRKVHSLDAQESAALASTEARFVCVFELRLTIKIIIIIIVIIIAMSN